MNSFNQTFRNLFYKILILFISLIATLYITGILGPKLFGLYTLIIVWLGFLIPMTSLGVGSGIIYSISNKSYSFQSVLSSNLLIAFIIGIVNIGLLFVFKLIGILDLIDATLQLSGFLLLMLSIFLQSVNFIMGRALLGNSDFKKLNKLDLLNSLLNPLILLGVLFFVGVEDSAFIYLAIGIASFILFACNWYLLQSQFKWTGLDLNYVRGAFNYGIKSWIGDVALKANLRLDQLILGSFISLNALGVYSVAVKLIELIWMIPDTVGPVLFNAIAGISDRQTKLKLLFKVHRLVFGSSLILILGWILICQAIIIPSILGEEYKEAFNLMLLLAPGILIFISSKIVTKLFSASGEVHWTSRITVIGSFISVVCYLVLIPRFGSAGAAIASSIGYISFAVAGNYILKENYQVQLKEYYAIRKEDLTWLKERVLNLVKGNSAIQ